MRELQLEAPKLGGGPVRKRHLLSTAEGGRQPTTFLARGSRRQLVDARKDGYQPLLIDPAADKPTTQPGVEKLLSRHDTVLSAGELNDDLGGIRSSRIHSQNIDRRRIKDGALK